MEAGLTLITLLITLIAVILDKLLLNFKFTTLFINIWKAIWELLKQMGSIKGVISFSIVWIILSGVGLMIVGFIIRNAYLKYIGGIIFLFWLGPMTPLVPLVIALALVFQRYVLRDKSVGIYIIKESFKKIKEGEASDTKRSKSERRKY